MRTPAAPPRTGNERETATPGPRARTPPPDPDRAAPPPLLKILVPAYFFPAGAGLQDWNRLIEAAPQVPIIAIVNPDSGPGKASNPDYAAIVSRAKEAGVEVIGYVNTDYGKRPRQEIEADIDRWVQFYPDIQGIFLDAQASEAEHVDLYAALRTFVRQKIKEAVVIGNPGTICAEGYSRDRPWTSPSCSRTTGLRQPSSCPRGRGTIRPGRSPRSPTPQRRRGG